MTGCSSNGAPMARSL